MKKNDELTVLIEGYTSEGFGVAKPEGFVLFIPSTIKGEKVTAHVTKANKNFGYAKAMEIITPSKHRIDPLCEKSVACGGCSMWHMTYEEELRFKWQKVYDNLRKSGIDCKMNDIVPSPKITQYRNKAQYPIREQGGQTVGGFYRKNSHSVIECPCAIQPEVFGRILRFTLDFMKENGIKAYNESDFSGKVRHLYLRCSGDLKSVMVCLVVKGKFEQKFRFAKTLKAKFPEICTVCINYNDKNTNVVLGKRFETVLGDGYITDKLLGYEFEISPESFYQVNHDGCEKLYGLVKEYTKGAKNLLDLYCGIGTIGLCVSDGVESLTGIEIVQKAIENAVRNAKINKVENCKFAAMDASQAGDFADEYYDTIIVDPPRKGCDKKTLEYLVQKRPEKLVYVSCDSATLARDLKYLCENGFEINQVTPVDMFPRTSHVECVVRLCRNKHSSI